MPVDGRHWEQVSPADKHGGVLFAVGAQPASLKSSLSGNAFTYVLTRPTEPGVEGFATNVQALSSRGAGGGWTSQDILLPHAQPTGTVIGSFLVSVDLEDPDGDSAVGVLHIGDATLTMDRPGAFSIEIDGSQWPPGDVMVSATVCDGWSEASYDASTLGSFQVVSLF